MEGKGMTMMFAEDEVPQKPGGKKDTPKIKGGFDFGEVASAMQKEIRKGDEVAALTWGLLLFDVAPYYAFKRVVVTASEDIGLADVQAVTYVNAAYTTWRAIKEKSFHVTAHQFGMAVMVLCRAKKSTEVEDLMSSIYVGVFEDKQYPEMPEYAVDCHTARGKVLHPGLKGDQKFYEDRHRTFGIPTNKYTARLASFRPAWFETIKDLMPKARRAKTFEE